MVKKKIKLPEHDILPRTKDPVVIHLTDINGVCKALKIHQNTVIRLHRKGLAPKFAIPNSTKKYYSVKSVKHALEIYHGLFEKGLQWF